MREKAILKNPGMEIKKGDHTNIPYADDLFDLIDRLIENKIKMGKFQESRLSFGELELCKEVFKDYIKTFYHQRISYPEPVSSGQEFL
jgi:membrane-associated HD superfamily phosphohydrolase